MRKLLPLMLMLGLLSACGGHHHDDDQPSMPPATGGGTPAPDVFASQVAKVVATAPDDSEPAALDDSAPTMPENTEPLAVAP